MNLIYSFHNMYIICGVLVYALCFYDRNHLMWQIYYGLDNLNLIQNGESYNSELKKYMIQCIQYLKPVGVGFGFAFTTTLVLILFYSMEIFSTTLYMIFFLLFMYCTMNVKEYNMSYFIQASVFIGTFALIGSNYFIQKTLRTFFIFNL